MYIQKESMVGTYEVDQLSEFIFKLTRNDPLSEFLTYGTIIEVEKDFKEENGEQIYVFKKVHKESDYNLEVIGLPFQLNETELRIIGKMIIDEGGFWEVIFGGLGYVNLPKNSSLNITTELNKLIQLKRSN